MKMSLNLLKNYLEGQKQLTVIFLDNLSHCPKQRLNQNLFQKILNSSYLDSRVNHTYINFENRNNYKDAIQEYNKYMNKVADKLNKSLDEMNNIWKTWTKIRDKYRKKDKKEKF